MPSPTPVLLPAAGAAVVVMVAATCSVVSAPSELCSPAVSWRPSAPLLPPPPLPLRLQWSLPPPRLALKNQRSAAAPAAAAQPPPADPIGLGRRRGSVPLGAQAGEPHQQQALVELIRNGLVSGFSVWFG